LLASSLLDARVHGGCVVPRYLTERDEVWVRELVAELDGLVGRAARDVDRALSDRIVPRACASGASPRAARAMAHVCSRHWPLRTVSPLPPQRVRRIVFEAAAQAATRDEALAVASERLGASREDVLASLFADRPEERRLCAPPAPPSTRELVLRYNLSLLQGLLLRATGVDILARSGVRSVVRYAKLLRLLCTFSATADGMRIALSGPLSVLRHTTRYGRALATFVPAAVVTPGWSLEARCNLDGREGVLHASCADPIASTHALPRDYDSAVERCLARDVRRLGTSWSLARETEAIDVGGRLFFPDFTLSRGADRVLVEVVGYHTPEYLASKLRALRAAGLRRIVVCVDESLACGSEAICAGAVLRFRRRVDARALVEAAERLVGEAR
jgi:predicted nuclease of restriction endonuclease-like RecB superfamily